MRLSRNCDPLCQVRGGDVSMATARVTEGEMEQRRSLLPPYVLITPARNEEAFIEKTIESVIHQTVLPTKWVIVDDGSKWSRCLNGETAALQPKWELSTPAMKDSRTWTTRFWAISMLIFPSMRI